MDNGMTSFEQHTINEMERLAARRAILRSEIDQRQNEIDQIEEDLKADLRKLGTDSQVCGVFNVSNKWVYSHRFDSKRFKAENEKIYNAYVVPNNYPKFMITCG